MTPREFQYSGESENTILVTIEMIDENVMR